MERIKQVKTVSDNNNMQSSLYVKANRDQNKSVHKAEMHNAKENAYA